MNSVEKKAFAYAIAFLDGLPLHWRDGPLLAAMSERLQASCTPLELARLMDDIEARSGRRIEFGG